MKFYLSWLTNIKLITYYEIFRSFYFEFQNFDVSLHPNMRIVSHRKLKEFFTSHGREDSKDAIERWYAIAESALWQNLSDVKRDFPSVDFVGNQHYVFNIKGNKYRLVVVIKFTIGYIFVRFIGTHKEYDKIDCSTI